MNWRRPILPPLPTLAAGQAPAAFAHVIERRAARVQTLRRVSGWVAVVSEQHFCLNAEPLFGRCLAGLLSQPDPPADAPTETGRSQGRGTSSALSAGRQPSIASGPVASLGLASDARTVGQPSRSTQPLRWEGRAQAERSARDAAAPHSAWRANLPDSRPIQAVLELPARAAPALLRSLVSEAAIVGVQPLHTVVLESRGTGQPQVAAARQRDDWGSAAADAARLLGTPQVQSFQLHPATALSATMARLAAQPFQPVATQATAGAAPLTLSALMAEQLALPINGPQVPREFLLRLANGQFQPGGIEADYTAPRITEEPGQSGDRVATNTAPRRRNSTAGLRAEPGLRADRGGNGVTRSSAPTERLASGHYQRTPQESRLPQSAHEAQAPWASEMSEPLVQPNETTAPPAMASQLPPLLPPQQPGVPALPLAAAGARQGAWIEAMEELDLDALADNIKRILDEQARRHGIDV